MKERYTTLTVDAKGSLMLQSFIERISDDLNIQNTYFGNIVTCLHEAFENAQVHGKGKSIRLEASFDNNYLNFKMQQPDGNTFNVNEVLKRIDPLETKGLFLIQHLCDTFEFEDEGRTLVMHFLIQKESAPLRKTMGNKQNLLTTSIEQSRRKMMLK